MREAEISLRHVKYHERKPLDKRYIIAAYILAAAFLVITVASKHPLFLFVFVTLISSLINYQTNLPTIRFNPDPEVFLSLFLTRVIGLNYALLMLFIPTLLVDIYTARLDKDTFISILLTAAACLVMSATSANFVVLGLVLVTARFLLGLGANLLLDISIEEIVFEHILGFGSNVILFLVLGDLVRFF